MERIVVLFFFFFFNSFSSFWSRLLFPVSSRSLLHIHTFSLFLPFFLFVFFILYCSTLLPQIFLPFTKVILSLSLSRVVCIGWKVVNQLNLSHSLTHFSSILWYVWSCFLFVYIHFLFGLAGLVCMSKRTKKKKTLGLFILLIFMNLGSFVYYLPTSS